MENKFLTEENKHKPSKKVNIFCHSFPWCMNWSTFTKELFLWNLRKIPSAGICLTFAKLIAFKWQTLLKINGRSFFPSIFMANIKYKNTGTTKATTVIFKKIWSRWLWSPKPSNKCYVQEGKVGKTWSFLLSVSLELLYYKPSKAALESPFWSETTFTFLYLLWSTTCSQSVYLWKERHFTSSCDISYFILCFSWTTHFMHLLQFIHNWGL